MSRCQVRFMLWAVEALTQRLVRSAERTNDSVLLGILGAEPNAEIETAVSMNPAVGPETLLRLLDRARMMAGTDEEWREHILRNPAFPVESLREVMHEDPSEVVRVRAACVLAERLSGDSQVDSSLVAECGDFLANVDARSDYPGVKPALHQLRPLLSGE